MTYLYASHIRKNHNPVRHFTRDLFDHCLFIPWRSIATRSSLHLGYFLHRNATSLTLLVSFGFYRLTNPFTLWVCATQCAAPYWIWFAKELKSLVTNNVTTVISTIAIAMIPISCLVVKSFIFVCVSLLFSYDTKIRQSF